MEDEWIGQAVSIICEPSLGVFQGMITASSDDQLTITRVFRNGVPLRKQDSEVTLRAGDILSLTLIPAYNGQNSVTPTVINEPTPVKQPNFANAGNANTANGVNLACAPYCDIGTFPAVPNITLAYPDISTQLSNLTLQTWNPSCSPTLALAASVPFPPYGMNGSSRKSSPTILNSSSVAKFFGRVECRMGPSIMQPQQPSPPRFSPTAPSPLPSSPAAPSPPGPSPPTAENHDTNDGASTRPVDIPTRGFVGRGGGPHNVVSKFNGNGRGGNGNGNGKWRNGQAAGNGHGNGGNKRSRRQARRENSLKHSQTFGDLADDQLQKDFDFEGNLALFDKKALWNDIESKNQISDQPQQLEPVQKYRHDENILASEPIKLRQIETMFEGSGDFVTDEGLIIPTIPTFVRSKIEISAAKEGLTAQRQGDGLARGAADLAISLMGGARRLTPNNHHQWPKIIVICEKSANFRCVNIGATASRILASHGLRVTLYLEEDKAIETKSTEVALFKSTGNNVVYSVTELLTPDLVILSTNSVNLSPDVKKWLSENRASIFAIDPPPVGIRDVQIKYAILPILPLNGISTNNCGKLYLCNLGIPDKFYRDSGIKYKSPFGHKYVIPIHSKD